MTTTVLASNQCFVFMIFFFLKGTQFVCPGTQDIWNIMLIKPGSLDLSHWWHLVVSLDPLFFFGGGFVVFFFFVWWPVADPSILSMTSDLLIFLLLFLIFTSTPALTPANWIVSLQMVLEASPCKLDASLPRSPINPFYFLSPLLPPLAPKVLYWCVAHTSMAHPSSFCAASVSARGSKLLVNLHTHPHLTPHMSPRCYTPLTSVQWLRDFILAFSFQARAICGFAVWMSLWLRSFFVFVFFF